MPRAGATPKVRARAGVSVALAIVLISAGADVSSGRPSLAWAAIGNTTKALITIATIHTRAPLKCTPLPRRNRAIVVAAFAESSGCALRMRLSTKGVAGGGGHRAVSERR